MARQLVPELAEERAVQQTCILPDTVTLNMDLSREVAADARKHSWQVSTFSVLEEHGV